MLLKFAKSKFLAVFVAAFVCLNVAGGACMVYCNFAMSEKVSCPLAKMGNDCPMSDGFKSESGTGVKRGSKDCCAINLNFIAGKHENTGFSFDASAEISEKITFDAPRAVKQQPTFTYSSYQRPPNDRRGQRLKNCIFLI